MKFRTRYPDRIALPIDLKFNMSGRVDLLLHLALIKVVKNGFKKGNFKKNKVPSVSLNSRSNTLY